MIFLNEGVKTFHRVYYALLKLARDDILSCSNASSIKSVIKKKSLILDREESKKFFKDAFTLRLVKYSFGRSYENSIDSEEYYDNVRYYLPTIMGES